MMQIKTRDMMVRLGFSQGESDKILNGQGVD